MPSSNRRLVPVSFSENIVSNVVATLIVLVCPCFGQNPKLVSLVQSSSPISPKRYSHFPQRQVCVWQTISHFSASMATLDPSGQAVSDDIQHNYLPAIAYQGLWATRFDMLLIPTA
ncbi:hypothetical protein WJX77_002231 [Trebouxia sp. C0004]